MPNQKPVHEIRLGAIKATIWANETSVGTRHSVNVSRLYKDGDEWKRSDSFGATTCCWWPRWPRSSTR